MSIRFDHTYTVDMNQKFRNKLGKAGFKFDDRMVEHPGKAFCRFIMIPENKKSGRQYLEFIHLGDPGSRSQWYVGLSLGANTPLESFVKKIKGINAKFAHKNYDWKENSVDRLPGWNFITFPEHKSKIYTWITEYEKSKKRKLKSTKNLKHPNQVYRFVALDMDFENKDVHLYSKLLGKLKNNSYTLQCGTVLQITKAKKTKLKSVVLATKDLSHVVKKFKWDELTVFNGQPAVRISNPEPSMWDILIVQG